jgi:hypothetical protein
MSCLMFDSCLWQNWLVFGRFSYFFRNNVEKLEKQTKYRFYRKYRSNSSPGALSKFFELHKIKNRFMNAFFQKLLFSNRSYYHRIYVTYHEFHHITFKCWENTIFMGIDITISNVTLRFLRLRNLFFLKRYNRCALHSSMYYTKSTCLNCSSQKQRVQ